MNKTIIVISGTESKITECRTLSELNDALLHECRNFIEGAEEKRGGWINDANVIFEDLTEAAYYLFGKCMIEANFGDICKILMVDDFPHDGDVPRELLNKRFNFN